VANRFVGQSMKEIKIREGQGHKNFNFANIELANAPPPPFPSDLIQFVLAWDSWEKWGV